MDIRLREIIKDTLKPYEDKIRHLKKYAQHLDQCDVIKDYIGNKNICNCGLTTEEQDEREV